MARVFVFGAGASRAVKNTAPLNDELLPCIFELPCDWLHRRLFPEERVRIDAFIEFVCEIYLRGIAPCEIDDLKQLPPLEDVLSQLDYCIAEQRPLSEKYQVKRLEQLREDLIFALYKVFETKLGWHERGLMERFIKHTEDDDVIVSLNYDLILDNAFDELGKNVDYGISARKRHRIPEGFDDYPKRGRRVYKLHGSLNWMHCPLCQAVDVFVGQKSIGFIFDERNPQRSCTHCQVRYEPIIITPTFLKSYRNSFITQIWQTTEAAIREASEVVFIGYSMPDADIILRTMSARALFQNRQAWQITLVDYVQAGDGESERNAKETRERYERLFGPIREDRYFSGGFAKYVEHLGQQ